MSVREGTIVAGIALDLADLDHDVVECPSRGESWCTWE